MKQDEMGEQVTAEQSWQEALDLPLTQRLLRPAVQPGLARSQLAGAILARSQRLTGHLPLLGQVVQRYRTAEDLAAGQVPIVYARPRFDDVGPPGALAVPLEASPPQRPVAQARVAPPAEPGARPDAGSQRTVIQRAVATTPTGALPVVQPTVEPPAEPADRPDAGSQRAVLQRAAATTPSGALPVVRPTVERPAEPADRPAVVARPIKDAERRGRPASTAPARPLVAPSRSAGQTGVIQRSLDRLLVVEDRRPGWSETSPPPAFQPSAPVSSRGEPVGHRSATAMVVQRAASDGELSSPVSAGQIGPPVVQRANVETELDLEKLAERVQRELDMEALVAKVQRQLRQRLAVESERRGWVQWP
jgi:hypothetical protein